LNENKRNKNMYIKGIMSESIVIKPDVFEYISQPFSVLWLRLNDFIWPSLEEKYIQYANVDVKNVVEKLKATAKNMELLELESPECRKHIQDIYEYAALSLVLLEEERERLHGEEEEEEKEGGEEGCSIM
jgi:hypothetical protein